MTPQEELAVYGTTVIQWDMGRGDDTMQHIPLEEVYRTPGGVHMSRARYLQVRRRLRKYEFYATRVIGPNVVKKKCTAKVASERHGYICNPDDWRQRLGLTMLLVKDDDPCSNKVLSQQLEDASRVTGWKKDAEGIMRPVHATMKEQV